MDMTISEDILQAIKMSEAELRQEIAVYLFEKEKLTLGQAGRLAGMPLLQFQRFLAGRGITVHYDVAEFEEDLETLKNISNK
jgi:predicted HTH domain antitoxin